MSLYVRVFSDFFSHRKTARLRVLLGDAAYWLPIRLWTYAAEHQPDGDFSRYEPGELASLLGYTGDASSMLQALLQACFMDQDPLRIHDWQEHNGYHSVFAVRAKAAAQARWAKRGQESPPTPPLEDTKKEKEKESQALLKHCFKHDVSITRCTARAAGAAPASSSDLITKLAANPAYSGIDVAREFAKMQVWCGAHHKNPTERRFIAWLNRVDRPLPGLEVAASASKAPERATNPVALSMLLKEQEGLKRAEMQRLRFKHGCGEWPRDFSWSASAPVEVKERHKQLAAEVRELEQRRANIPV